MKQNKWETEIGVGAAVGKDRHDRSIESYRYIDKEETEVHEHRFNYKQG